MIRIIRESRSLSLLMAFLSTLLLSQNLYAQDGVLNEEYRPQFHYAPPVGWMNDPNGLVFYEGEYHLFYQYNPFGDEFGNIGWGHAVSSDQINWDFLPLAIPPENQNLIFSGSAVVDKNNTSGFCTAGEDGDNSCLVAIYTTNRPNPDGVGANQTQDLAYSNDNGRNWTKYEGNPVIDRTLTDFRDPKVFWHEESSKWVMSIVLPLEKKIVFYGSPNLKEWSLLSEFGPAAATGGIWECPDLFPLTMQNDQGGVRKWVLKVDLNPGSIAGGSGGQYFIGDFNGQEFIPEGNIEEPKWLDYGKDFYCATTYDSVPDEEGTRSWLGWMNNWSYASDIPTSPWRGTMTLPRDISLAQNQNGEFILKQSPVSAVEKLRKEDSALNWNGTNLTELNQALSGAFNTTDTFEIEITIPQESIANFQDRISFILSNLNAEGGDSGVVAQFNYDYSQNLASFIRNDEGNAEVNPSFPYNIDFKNPVNPVTHLRFLVDRNGMEVFLNEGETVLTNLLFPQGENVVPQLSSSTNTLPFPIQVRAWPLESIWFPQQ